MKQFSYLGDVREVFGFCVFCGKDTQTKDHIISKVFLDKPYPKELPTIGACLKCNQSFSLDEEYLACLIEVTLNGSVEPESINREKVSRILERKPALVSKLRLAKQEINNRTYYSTEPKRVKNIVLKIARGLAAFELNQPMLDEPLKVSFIPLFTITGEERGSFEMLPEGTLWPEVGTRAFQRWAVDGEMDESKWLNVQHGRFRFLTIFAETTIIRMVIGEYLACEVVWDYSKNLSSIFLKLGED